jgi:hypothetical protein
LRKLFDASWAGRGVSRGGITARRKHPLKAAIRKLVGWKGGGQVAETYLDNNSKTELRNPALEGP